VTVLCTDLCFRTAKSSKDATDLASQLSSVCEIALDDRVRAFASDLYSRVPRAAPKAAPASAPVRSRTLFPFSNFALFFISCLLNKQSYKAQQAADLAARKRLEKLNSLADLEDEDEILDSVAKDVSKKSGEKSKSSKDGNSDHSRHVRKRTASALDDADDDEVLPSSSKDKKDDQGAEEPINEEELKERARLTDQAEKRAYEERLKKRDEEHTKKVQKQFDCSLTSSALLLTLSYSVDWRSRRQGTRQS
jgi:hypothetical protein